MSETIVIHSDPREALNAFLIELHEVYYRWYDRSVSRLRRTWYLLHWSGIAIGAGTSAFAAFALSDYSPKPWVRSVLILFPLLAAFLSTIVVQSGLVQRFEMRESGRRGIQALINDGRRRVAIAVSREEISTIHAELVEAVNVIETEQGASFFAIARSAGSASNSTVKSQPSPPNGDTKP